MKLSYVVAVSPILTTDGTAAAMKAAYDVTWLERKSHFAETIYTAEACGSVSRVKTEGAGV